MTSAVLYERIDRAVKMATTYVRKAGDALYWPGAPSPPLTGYWTLLDAMLDAATEIVERLPDDFFTLGEGGDYFGLGFARYNLSDDVLERAEKVVAAIKLRRESGKQSELIERLDNTTGRTPEEAALYRAKAEELRQRRAS